MRILTKEIDIFKSLTQKGKFISQFIIYLMCDQTPVTAYIEYGIEARDKRIKELNEIYVNDNQITNQYLIN